MKIIKQILARAKVGKRHYARTEDIAKLLKIEDTSFSKINPTKTHMNYNLCEKDMIEELNKKLETAYMRNKKTDIAYTDLCITYPKNCNVPPDVFFKNIYNILLQEEAFKNCIGAFVHYDETRIHMHHLSMPLQKCDMTKTKRIKVYDEKKNKEVQRNVKTHYTEQFNCKKVITKELLNNLHPYLQDKLKEIGIECDLITKERAEFNAWKKETIKYYNDLIEQNPNEREKLINEFWELCQEKNPRLYTKNQRAKDNRLAEFQEMVDGYKKQEEKNKKQEEENNKMKLEHQQLTDLINFDKIEIANIENELASRHKEMSDLQKERIEYEALKRIYITDKEGNFIVKNNQYFLTEWAVQMCEEIQNETLADLTNTSIDRVKEIVENKELLEYVNNYFNETLRGQILERGRKRKYSIDEQEIKPTER